MTSTAFRKLLKELPRYTTASRLFAAAGAKEVTTPSYKFNSYVQLFIQ